MTNREPLRLLTLNIEGDRHLKDRVIPFLVAQKPDVACLQEVPSTALPALRRAVGGWIHFAPQTIIRGIASGVVIASHLSRDELPSDLYYVRVGYGFPEYRDKDSTSYHRVFSWVTVEYRGATYRIGTLHHTWTAEGVSTPEQRADAASFLEFARGFPDLIWCGDTNAPRITKDGGPGATWAMFAAEYRDNIPSGVTSTIDPKLHRAAPLPLVVDGIFSTPHYDVFAVEVISGVSDHCAIVARVLCK